MENLLDKKGCKFSATIDNIGEKTYGTGTIQVEDGVVYLCQDYATGVDCKDKLGYKYSWQVGIGSYDDLENEFVSDFKLIKENYLPEYWAVKCDGSDLYTDVIKSYFKDHYDDNTYTCDYKGNYYGFDGNLKYRVNLSNFKQGTQLLTLEEFINLTTIKTTIKTTNYEKSIKVQRKIATISIGNSISGCSISSGRNKIAINVGHLSYTKVHKSV
jgi:hypothetical protein